MTEIQDCLTCDRTFEVTSDSEFHCVDCRKMTDTDTPRPMSELIAQIEALCSEYARYVPVSELHALIRSNQPQAQSDICPKPTLHKYICPKQNAEYFGQAQSEVDDLDVEIAIAEAIQLIPNGTTYEEKGTPVLAYLKKHGWKIVDAQSPYLTQRPVDLDWQPIKTASKEITRILAWDGHTLEMIDYGENWCSHGCYVPTHWALVKPPYTEKGGR